MKWFKRILVLLIVVIAYIGYTQYPKLVLISGYAAKYTATSVGHAHNTLDYINAHDNNAPLIKLANTSAVENLYTSNVYGLKERKAIFKKGIGSVLLNDDYTNIDHLITPQRGRNSIALPYPYGDLKPIDTLLTTVNYSSLTTAIQTAFEHNELSKTRSVLVLYKGFLIGEQYIDNYNADKPILGWSMNKSILATLYGILQSKGVLEVTAAIDLPSWKNDARSSITIDNLLRMESGLEWDESYDKISDATTMLFLSSDMGEVQEHKKMLYQPKAHWNYSSGTTNLLSKNLKKYFNTQQEYIDFLYDSLIDKIGMHSYILEQDLSGTYVGSSYGWASTRDWGKFGLLYLNRGKWNGTQLFDPSWVEYISEPTEDSDGDYGAHFWLNASGILKDVPRDMYSANGHDGQFVYIIPSKELVVVRTGLSEDYDANKLLAGIIASISN